MAREARILTALQDSDVPVPQVFGVWTADGVPMVLMEFVDGLVLDRKQVVDGVTEPTRHAIGLSIARALAPVHAVDLDKAGLVDLASHKPYAERQLKRWTTQWQHSKTRESADLDALTARLAAAIPEQRELTLVHGDFHMRNVIVSPEDGSVASVLDWELCTLGDPLADVGTLLAYWPATGEAGEGLLSFSAAAGLPGPRGDGRGLPRSQRPRRLRAGLLARAGPVEDRHHRRGRAAPHPGRAAQPRRRLRPDHRPGRLTDRQGTKDTDMTGSTTDSTDSTGTTGTPRTAIVTGAARGIGAAVAARLAADGHAVAVVDLDETACADTVAAITKAGGKALAVGCRRLRRGAGGRRA